MLAPQVWEAATQANETWVSIPELLDATGERIAELCGAPAARVVPGASAAIALGVAACIVGEPGPDIERLPAVDRPRRVVLQRGHRYKYARCALLAGAELVEPPEGEDAFVAALEDGAVAVLHPGHLDGGDGTLALDRVVSLAHRRGVPVVVDAAYLSFPLERIGSFTAASADLACFSAKYFHGPNAGGFVLGTTELVEAVARLDFTGYESGPYRTFGRAFKMDRATVAATTVALERWLALDHGARLAGYERRVRALADELGDLENVDAGVQQFTLDERLVDEDPNALVLRPAAGASWTAGQLADRLADGDPRVMAVAEDGALVVCAETVPPEQDAALAGALRAALAR